VVGGLSEGNVQLSIAIVSDVTTQKTRSRDLVSNIFYIFNITLLCLFNVIIYRRH
jgi:hypothetical protein